MNVKNRTCPACGSAMNQTNCTKKHKMFEREIEIQNAPIENCTNSTCDYSEYTEPHKVTILLRDAYRSGQTEINFETN